MIESFTGGTFSSCGSKNIFPVSITAFSHPLIFYIMTFNFWPISLKLDFYYNFYTAVSYPKPIYLIFELENHAILSTGKNLICDYPIWEIFLEISFWVLKSYV